MTKCIFDYIVLTAPSETIAEVYHIQLQYMQRVVPELRLAVVECVADPGGLRVGSGGGTAHALASLAARHGAAVEDARVLVVHSGGDSRRAPMYSVCGKAWMTLADDERSLNPLLLLIDELSALFGEALPSPSVVVGCSDVLLDLRRNQVDRRRLRFETTAAPAVHVLCVAAPALVAQNHGVVCQHELLSALSQSSHTDTHTDTHTDVVRIADADRYLQKPSLQEMERTHALFDCAGEQCALIDTGVVLFAGAAARALFSLSAEWRADERRPRFELYDELLGACRTTHHREGEVESVATAAPWQRTMHAEFGATALRVLYVQGGRFTHLGTTKEALSLLCAQSRIREEVSSSRGACVRLNSLCAELKDSHCAEVVVEHSVACVERETVAPSRGFFSNLYAKICHEFVSHSENALTQLVFIESAALSQSLSATEPLCALLSLSVDDDVKALFSTSFATVCGLSWEDFFVKTGTSVSDIWDESERDKSIWNARLFSVCQCNGRDPLSVYAHGEWVSVEMRALSLSRLVESDNERVCLWRDSHKLSLRELLCVADAQAEFLWRVMLTQARSLSLSLSNWTALDQLHVALRRTRLSCPSFPLLAATLLIERTESEEEREGNHGALLSVFSQSASSTTLQFLRDITSLFTNIDSEMDVLLRHLLRDLVDDSLSLALSLLAFAPSMLPQRERALPRLLLLCSWLCERCTEVISEEYDARSTLDLRDYSQSPRHSIVGFLGTVCDSLRKTTKQDNIPNNSLSVSEFLATAAQRLVCVHVQWSLRQCSPSALLAPRQRTDKVCVANSPVRVDCAGGWSDTPPICYDQGGAVLNVAVKVDGQDPIRCAARCIDHIEIRLQSWQRSEEKDGELVLSGDERVRSIEELNDLSLTSPCALLKACCLVLFHHSEVSSRDSALEAVLTERVGRGLSVACFSNLPAGSGMGGSSILAATILQCVATLIGTRLSNDSLVHLVSEVEQCLTTGGGWQDQIGGTFPGFKIARSEARLPLGVHVQALPVSRQFVELFNERVFLIFTGQQRLAKNTLLCALQKYSVICRGSSGVHTVSKLIQNAEDGAQLLSDQSIDEETRLDGLAAVLNRYWSLKVEMASQSEPPHVKALLARLRDLSCGLSLCGAGAGGFGVLILRRDASPLSLFSLVDEMKSSGNDSLSVHRVAVDEEGLSACLLEDDGSDLRHFLR